MTSDRLFGRVVRVIIGPPGDPNGLLIQGLRVVFKVTKSTSKEPNECEATIYNLSGESRAKMQAKGTRIIVEAGYGTTAAQIFSGDSRFVDHEHKGPDWETKIQCGDGERAYRYTKTNESFRAGTALADVFARIAAATGLDVTEAVAMVRANVSEQFTQGFTAFGKASKEIDRLLKGRGLEWSIQDNRLQVVRTGTTTATETVILSVHTGLIGSPTHGSPVHGEKVGSPAKGVNKPQVLKIKSLLNPKIRAGGLVLVDSIAVKGAFRVQSVAHSGDTNGGEFYSEIDAVPVQ